MSNSVKKKYVFCIGVKLVSPICISSGDGSLTDNDVIRDYEGNPFIPGSSLAGAMRAYLNAEGNVKCIFGNRETSRNASDDRMSSVFVSDLFFTKKPNTSVRDGVKLTEEKTAETGAKFDMEIVDTGATGEFFLELIVRSDDNEAKMLNELKTVFYGLCSREIRFGSKKTRGYGEVEISSLKMQKYDSGNITDYAVAYQPDRWTNLPDVSVQWISSERNNRYICIKMPVELEGCISIRQYAAKKNQPDYVHITANGEPVIPGTSLTGAIRHRISDLLRYDLQKEPSRYLNTMFGYVDVRDEKNPAKRSMITVGEAVLENSKALTITRNGISRFESGAKERALFKELSYQGGTTEFVIMIERNRDEKAMAGLLLLALMDIQNGFLSIGGQASVGKGIFHAAGDIIMDAEEFNEEACLRAASEWIDGGV